VPTDDPPPALGAFLRARRGVVQPGDVGLVDTGRRRTPGLRREEVALLAGVSVEYYLRLEQGRDRSPSAQVLDALAEVLQLDDDARAHLHELARPRPRRLVRRRTEPVPPTIAALLPSLGVPAFVQNRYTDVVAANDLAAALSPHMTVGVNRLRALFTDPAARDLHPDWEQGTVGAVAHLRATMGSDTDDARLAELVGELSLESERFRVLWARQDVRRGESATTVLDHPQVGRLELHRDKFAVEGADRLLLVVYHAPADTPSGQALALLGSLTVGAPDLGGTGQARPLRRG
jgi:transcriptional regulator with XRE-family HTH domain